MRDAVSVAVIGAGPAAGPRLRGSVVAAAAVVAAGTSAALHVGKVAIALPLLAEPAPGRGWVVDAAQSGVLLAVPGLVGSTCVLAVGWAARSRDARTAMLVGLVLAAFASAAAVGADSAAHLQAWRVLEALGGLVVLVCAPVLISQWVGPAARGRALSWWSCAMPAGTGAVALAGPPLLALGGWGALWCFTAGFSVACAVAVAALVPSCRGLTPPGATEAGPSTDVLDDGGSGDGHDPVAPRAAAWGPVLALAAVFGLYTLQWSAVSGYLPTVLTRAHVDLALVGVVTGAVLVANIGGNLVGGHLVSRSVPGHRVVIVASATMAVAGLVTFAPGAPVWVVSGAALVMCGCGGAVPAALFALSARGRRGSAMTRSALLTQGSQLGSVAGPACVVAVVSLAGSWGLVGVATAAAAATACLLALVIGWGERNGSFSVAQRRAVPAGTRTRAMT